jgi:hypothetical protein
MRPWRGGRQPSRPVKIIDMEARREPACHLGESRDGRRLLGFDRGVELISRDVGDGYCSWRKLSSSAILA